MTHKNDILIIVDLEATCCDHWTIANEDMEIIEINACAVDLSNFSVVNDFQTFMKPVLHPELTAFCKDMSGIEQDTVDQAELFNHSIEHYRTWLSGFKCIKAWSTWGLNAKQLIERDIARHETAKLHEGLRYLNLGSLFFIAEGDSVLHLAFAKLGAEYESRNDCGKDYAFNISRLLNLSPKFGDITRSRVYDKRQERVLICKNCDAVLSSPVVIFSSEFGDNPDLDFSGGEDGIVVGHGYCALSQVNIVSASKAYSQFVCRHNKMHGKKKMQNLFSNRFPKPPFFSLFEIEELVLEESPETSPKYFSHLQFEPQYWMNLSDSLIHSNEDISWGWTGTNKPNVFCENCDAGIGTDILYIDLPACFIPDPNKTKWRDAP